MCLPPVTKSAEVTWYKQAKGVQPKMMHLPHASSLEEKCVPTTSHKVRSSDMVQASKRCSARKDASAACIKPRGKVSSDMVQASKRCLGGTRSFFFVVFLGYREDVHSMQAARPTKIPDEPMLCETPALSR